MLVPCPRIFAILRCNLDGPNGRHITVSLQYEDREEEALILALRSFQQGCEGRPQR